MSTTPEADFDLEKLFLPAWAKESPQHNRYEKFEGEPAGRGDRGGRGDRRDGPQRRPGGPGFGGRGPGGPGGSGGPGGPRGGQGRGGPERRSGPGAPGGPRPPGAGGPRREGGRPPFGRDDAQGRRPESFRPPAPAPLPELQFSLAPEELSVDMVAKQIRVTGRAYPLFDIAHLMLQKPERHTITFAVKKKPDGTAIQPLFLCALDESVWLAEEDAVQHVLDRHFATFYQPEKTQIDPPKGVYTFVAQCGMSGVVLGPPNYHDYQNQLRQLHTARFARMPFEGFKARVRIVKDEEVVKKWVEEQSWKTEFNCLNLPEPLKLPNMEEVEKHFRQVHLGNIIKPIEKLTLTGVEARSIRDRELSRMVRQRWEEQKRFPLQLATTLSQQFASRGLQFFKVNKTVTHVAVARPHYLDLEATPVSEGVKRIVDFINATTKCKHKQLLEALAPTPATPASTETPATEGQPAAEAAPAAPEPSSELATVMINLHWLLHQGHVIEFANGVLETAKKPLPRPPKPVKAPAQPAAANAVDAAIAATPETGEVTGGDAPAATSPAEPLSSDATVEPEATPGVEASPVSSETPPVS